jgi:hypothetical protein
VQVGQDELHRFLPRLLLLVVVVLILGGGGGGGEQGLVEMLLDGGRGAAAAGAEVDEGVAVQVGEVSYEEAGYDLGRRGWLEERDLRVMVSERW